MPQPTVSRVDRAQDMPGRKIARGFKGDYISSMAPMRVGPPSWFPRWAQNLVRRARGEKPR